MDVLSEVLKAVKLDGAIFFNAEFSAPWCFRSPSSRILAPYLSPDSGHVIIFHLLTDGRGYAQVEGDDQAVPLNAGDIIIFPHGDPHIMRNGSPVKAVDNEQELQRVLSQGLKVSRLGGGGEVTKFICGYMACDPQLSGVFLGGLPPIMKVHIRNDAALHRATSAGTNRVAGRRPRPGSRESSGLAASQAGPSLDDCHTRERGGDFSFRIGRAFSALSPGDPHCLSYPLAATARCAIAQIHE